MTVRAGLSASLATLLAALLAAPVLTEAAPGQQDAGYSERIEVPRQRFPACCPRPDWWDAVGEVPRIHSMEGFLEVWQDRALSAEQRAKALFQAIEDNQRTDDDITAAAVTYFFSVGRSYRYLRPLTEFGVGRYLDYDRPLVGYSGKPGDLSAGIVRNLATIYLADGEPERAVPLLEHILGPRRDEVNDHLLELTALRLGQALDSLGRDPEAITVLLAAKRDFDGDWESRLDDELAAIRGRMGLTYYLHDRRFSGPALVVLLALALAAGVFWRRRPRLG